MSDEVAQRFAAGRMLFDEGLLTVGGQKMVRGKIIVIGEQTGRRAMVWAKKPGARLDALDDVFRRAQLDQANDLLLLSNGKQWRATGWGLSDDAIARALKDGRRGLSENWAHGIVASLIALDLAAYDRAQAPLNKEPLLWFGASLGAALSVGALAFIIRRRQQRRVSTG